MTRRDEKLISTLTRYFWSEKETDILFRGTGTNAKKFAEMFQTGEVSFGDAPDMLIKKNNRLLIVEHFEFDSYKTTRKGSKNRQEQSRIDRVVEAKEPTEKGILYHDEINGESSYENYINNVRRNFSEHYSQIDTYKSNLHQSGIVDDSMIMEVLFLIEDVSPLGTMVAGQDRDSWAAMPVCLAQCKEFLELLDNSPKVNYVLACSGVGNSNYTWFF